MDQSLTHSNNCVHVECLVKKPCCCLVIDAARDRGAERSVAAALRIWFTPEVYLFIYFFSPRFSPKVLNRWV